MSIAAICIAVRNQLVKPSALAVPTTYLLPGWDGFPKSVCDLARSQGKPPPSAGDLFIGVHSGSWTTEDVEGLFEHVGVNVTISMKATYAPTDRWPQAAIYNLPLAPGATAVSQADSGQVGAKPGIFVLADAIRSQMHLDVNADAILNAANLLIDPYYGTASQTLNGFVEPLIFSGGDAEPVERGASWWEAVPKGPLDGISLTLRFSGGGRVQRIEQMGER